MTKKHYKCVTVLICEVDNGYDFEVTASFNPNVNMADQQTFSYEYVAKTEKEMLAILTKAIADIKPTKGSEQ